MRGGSGRLNGRDSEALRGAGSHCRVFRSKQLHLLNQTGNRSIHDSTR